MNERKPKEVYKGKIEQYKSEIKYIRNEETVLALIKLALAIGFVILFYLAAMAYTSVHLIGLIAIAVGFTVIAIIHESFIKKRRFIESLQSINEDEIPRKYESTVKKYFGHLEQSNQDSP